MGLLSNILVKLRLKRKPGDKSKKDTKSKKPEKKVKEPVKTAKISPEKVPVPETYSRVENSSWENAPEPARETGVDWVENTLVSELSAPKKKASSKKAVKLSGSKKSESAEIKKLRKVISAIGTKKRVAKGKSSKKKTKRTSKTRVTAKAGAIISKKKKIAPQSSEPAAELMLAKQMPAQKTSNASSKQTPPVKANTQSKPALKTAAELKLSADKVKPLPESKTHMPQPKNDSVKVTSVPVASSAASPSESGNKSSVSQTNHREEAEMIQKSFGNAPESKRMQDFIRHKAQGTIDEGKLAELEQKMNTVMEKYDISEREIEERLSGATTSDVLGSINRLVTIMELERETKSKELQPEKIITAMKITEPLKAVEKIKGVATEIKKHRLVTDFDKIVVFIATKGKARFSEISKETGIPKNKVAECCKLLEKENQINVVYPAIGEPSAQVIDYNLWKDTEKLKKINEKNQKKEGKKK